VVTLTARRAGSVKAERRIRLDMERFLRPWVSGLRGCLIPQVAGS
jgi:hypothetical protein